jgi:hypothetical protein
MKRSTLLILTSLLAIAGSLATLLWWAASGAAWFTLQKVLTTQTVVDEFGDKVDKEIWIDKFVPGLLDLAGPIAGALLVVAAIGFWFSRKDLKYTK